MNDAPRRVLVAGATGTIGQATVRALQRRGHQVIALLRPQSSAARQAWVAQWPGVSLCEAQVTDAAALAQAVAQHAPLDAVISCLASRSGAAADAWAIDCQAQRHLLAAARVAGAGRFVLLSAICVQRPQLAFQQAKLAFERELQASGLVWSIVRPTAFFKSLSGQIERVRQGKPFLVFGDGQLTACKPISDDDLGDYLAACLDDPAHQGRVLPIGGPGPAITPLQQGQLLFAALHQTPRFRRVPVALLDVIVAVLHGASWLWPSLAAKAELARIGRYYATESMLVWNAAAGAYDAAATPSTGTQTLAQHYAAVAAGTVQVALGEHAVFEKDGGRYRD